jgi:site-specific DNA-methyltransferase (adenine-specific)
VTKTPEDIARKYGAELGVILLSEIEVPERFRKEYGDLNELALSLKTYGQLQNLVVSKQSLEKPFRLAAGGRRYKAMDEKLQWTEAWALIFNEEPSELTLLEIEFEENTRRKDLTWQEDCALKKRIHDLLMTEHGAKTTPGPGESDEGMSLRDVAKKIEVSPATMSRDVNLAKAAELHPELFEGCKTKKDAQKMLSLAGEALIRGELAKRVSTKMAGVDSQLKNLVDRYIIEDFFPGVRKLPDGCMDFVEIDPPYAIALEKIKRDMNTQGSRQWLNMENYNEVDLSEYLKFIDATLHECKRVMAENSWLILWFAPEPWAELMYEILRNNGFETTRLTGKWIKPSGQSMRPEMFLANACEEFYYARKGNPTIVKQGRTNIFPYSPVPASKKIHPTERPIELIQDILTTFCWEGSRILVPFLGSGKTLLAAETLKMNALGFELSPNFKDGFLLAANELIGG